WAGAADSGAGPYSIVSKMSATFTLPPSGHGVPVRRRVPAGDVVLELPFDVAEERAGAEAEEVRAEPRVAQLLLHEDEPLERLLGGADPAGRLEADAIPGALVVLPDRAGHDQPHGE